MVTVLLRYFILAFIIFKLTVCVIVADLVTISAVVGIFKLHKRAEPSVCAVFIVTITLIRSLLKLGYLIRELLHILVVRLLTCCYRIAVRISAGKQRSVPDGILHSLLPCLFIAVLVLSEQLVAVSAIAESAVTHHLCQIVLDSRSVITAVLRRFCFGFFFVFIYSHYIPSVYSAVSFSYSFITSSKSKRHSSLIFPLL